MPGSRHCASRGRASGRRTCWRAPCRALVGDGRAAATRCFCGAAGNNDVDYHQQARPVGRVQLPLSEAMRQKTPSEGRVKAHGALSRLPDGDWKSWGCDSDVAQFRKAKGPGQGRRSSARRTEDGSCLTAASTSRASPPVVPSWSWLPLSRLRAVAASLSPPAFMQLQGSARVRLTHPPTCNGFATSSRLRLPPLISLHANN